MARPRLNRIIRAAVETSLVDQTKVDACVAAIARNPKAATLRWARNELCSGYGTLQVIGYFRGCWIVMRDGATLVHAHTGGQAVVAGLAGAKAVGLLHLSDGFGSGAPINDGLRWDLIGREQPLVEEPDDAPADEVLADDYQWGRERLAQILEEFGGGQAAADENLLIDIARGAARWQIPPPPWTRRGVGSYQLNTPYGLLTVQRTFGWVVKRDGARLTWMYNEKPIVFDSLEDAKASALVHAKDHGVDRFFDGTCWANARVTE